ncbi:MAG: acylphosphatase [Gammaproteobacteria bacterium]|nr:acylphosphatase [Gammaproteobacteria bacterium]
MDEGEGLSRAHLRIAGRVQGVGFRYATMLEAESRNLSGWVRNLPDGRVEVVAEGTTPAVQGLVAWCRDGPRHARVYDVDVAWESPRADSPGFRVA